MKHYCLLLFILLPALFFGQKQWTLEECVVYALENNIRVQQGTLNETLAEISVKQSQGDRLPNLNASGNHGYNWGRTIDGITNQIITQRIQRNSFGLSSNVTLFNGFQNKYSVEQNQVNLGTVKAQNDQLKNDVSLNVANAFLTVLFNKEFITIAQNNVNATQNQLEQVEKLFQAGQVPEGNLFEVQAQLANDEASLIQAESNLQISVLSLAQLLQIPYNETENFDVYAPGLEEIGLLDLPSSVNVVLNYALSNFPNMKISDGDVAFQELGVKIAKGGQLPNLRLNYALGTGFSDANRIGIGELQSFSQNIGIVESTGETVISSPQQFYTDFDTKPFGDQFTDNTNHSLFLNLSVPIFNGWSISNNIERANINLLNAELERENTKNLLTQDIERAWADAEVALKNYMASDKSVEASNKALEYAEIQYEQGVITLVEYNEARIRRDNALGQQINNKYDYIFKTKILDFYQGKAITL